jgi:GNAT superfamily N-acetyltransferase
VGSFFPEDYPELEPHNYCRVFVLPDPNDPTGIFGFYTLSPTALVRSRTSGSEQKRIPGGLAVPLILIGFMGRDDKAPKGLGAALLVDAARRVRRNPDIPAWGLALDSEGGSDNAKLWNWYQKQGFTPAKADAEGRHGIMYASLKKFPD